MATWITIALGIAVGLLCRRFAAGQTFGALTDVLLAITGAFAVRWLIDVLRQIGRNPEPYSWILVLCGAVLLRWVFYSIHRRNSQIHRSEGSSVSRQDSEPFQPMAKPQADSRKPAA